MSETDLELLDRYTRSKAEDAFTEIVRRHVDLVHSAALRQVRSPQLAEEVAQSTFLKLARRAAQLTPDTILAAWLYHVTRQESVDVVRREARRQLREQIATEMNAMNATAADWEQVEPLLDEAMHALDETDRIAVLLRYFQNKSLREVGAALGTSDDTAQKRVSRAVERLREYFNKNGVNVGASGLVMVISANAVQAAPATLTLTISTAAAVAAVTTAAQATAIIMSWINAKTAAAIVSAAVIAGTGTYFVQERHLATAQSQQRALLAQQAQLTTERDEALAKAQATRIAEESARQDVSDLARLRNEVTQLRQELATEKQRVAARAAAAPRETAPVANATQIEPGAGVGPIKFGMSMDDLKKTLGEPSRTTGRAQEYLSLGIAVLPGRDGTVGAVMMGDRGGGQLVEAFKGATKEGIGMKSTRQEVVAAYGQPETARDVGGGLEELRYDSGRTQYTLKDGRLVHIALRR